MKRIAILGCALGLYSTNLFAGSCDWATNTPADDARYKYLVAKVYSDVSAEDASTKAERDINSQLGRLFGVALDVQSDFYSDESTSAGTTRSYERSIGTIQLKGLERQKSDVARESGGWTGCVQYRYSQKDLERERKRLESLPVDKLSHTPFTEVLGDATCKGAPVEIRTVPENAFVTLDNGKYQGMSPIKFGNVCNGQHTLEISKENYKDVSEKLIVPSTKTINKTLTRDTKKITVSTSLGNSKISVNGVDYGTEPIKFNAPLGIEQTITAKHSDAVTVSRTRTFSKYSDDAFVMEMDKLPGKIDFSAFKVRNPDVQISVNGKTVKGNITGELSPDTEHRIKFSKKDFYDISETITLEGGKTTNYPSHSRTFGKDNSNWAQGRSSLVALGFVGGTQSDYGFGLNAGFELGVRSRTNNALGVRVGAGLQWSKFNIGKTSITYDNYKYKFTPLVYGKQPCPDGQTCQYVRFLQHTADGGYEDTYWGYFSNSDSPVISPKAQTVNWTYYEPLYANAGVLLWERFYIYGIGAIGFLKGETNTDRYLPATVSSMETTVFRFGAGIQWNVKDMFGVRLQYLTSGNKTSLPYNFNNSIVYVGSDSREHNNSDYVWLHRGEIKNLSAQKTIDIIQSFSFSFFVGF